MSTPNVTMTPTPALGLVTARARNPWVAAALTLLVPGLGHLYDGRPGRAGVLWLLWRCASIGVLALAMTLGARAQLLSFALIPAISLAIAIDAALCTRNASLDPRERWYTRWYVYVAVVLVSAVLVRPVAWMRSHVVNAYHVPSDSMAPTIRSGDFILAKPVRDLPHRGEIVTCRLNGVILVKRIVGIPGDTIGMSHGKLSVNGLVLDEPYATAPSNEDAADDEFAWQRGYLASGFVGRDYTPTRQTWGPLAIPGGNYFVLGDNRDNSLDSRYSGFVPRADIIAMPTIVYFSRDRGAHAVRWSRIGLALR